ncbi:MAG TPA: hypothetical protein VMV01_11840 [Planctomycetota bacterium]|jgi:hypothetical protein|nr:hypothetical protein [Planctomycetota bacterium]
MTKGARRVAAMVLALTGCGLALSCASTPLPPLPEAAIARLQPGTTTMADASALLGEPVATEGHADGTVSWIYEYAPGPLSPGVGEAPEGSRRKSDMLRLVFRRTGVLQTHEISHVVVAVEERNEGAAPPALISP